MRILEVSTNFRPGGIQRHVLDLAGDLAARGHHMVLAGDGGDWVAAARNFAFVPLGLDAVAHTGGSTARRAAAVLPVARALRKAIRREAIEVIHAHETAPAIVARMASLGTGIPIVMTFHGAAPEREAEVARVARRMADVTVSPSSASIEALIEKGLPRDRTRVIGLGIAQAAVPDAGDVAALRSRLLGPEGRFLVMSLSRLQHQKGIDIMIDVVATVRRQRTDLVFAVAGGGPQADEVSVWARAKGVEDGIRFLGPVATVPLHLAASDLFLLTSRWENLPISIVEAFRAGLPVVATDCGGVRELVDDAVGRLCQVGDVAGLSKAILMLAADADLRRQKAEAALARSGEARFDPAAVHGRFEALYEGLIARRG